MTRDDDFIGLLEGYLDDYEGSTPLPESLRDAVREQIVTTKQIGPLPGPMRYLSMTTSLPASARYGLAAAAVIGAVLVGAYAFGFGSNVGGDPEPTPTPLAFEEQAAGSLEPGTYAVSSIESTEIRFTVPAGWESALSPGSGEFVGPLGPAGGLSFWIVPNLFAEPCRHVALLDPPVGPGVDDLATALAAMPGLEMTTPTDVTVDGYSGRYVEMSGPDASGACDGARYAPWPSRPVGDFLVLSIDDLTRYWVLDVEGVRLVMMAHTVSDASEEGRAELQRIIDSVRIESSGG